MAGLRDGRRDRGDQRRPSLYRRPTSSTTCSTIAEWGKPLKLTIRRGLRSAVHVAPAARFVRRQHEPAQEGRDGLHDLPRRAGERDRLQVGLAHAERSAAGARLVAQVRLVRQPSLDFPDDARAVHREQLPEVPSRSGRARAERAVPRSAGAEAGRGLRAGAAVRLLRLPRDQRLRRPEQADRPRPARSSRITPTSPRRFSPIRV